MNGLDIGELSERTGVPVSTLRYYDEIGLVRSIGRHGLRRRFAPNAELQIAVITLGKLAGFSLEEISGLLEGSGARGLPRPALHARADEIDAQIRGLEAMRDMLRHIADCRAPSHLECPKFRKLLRDAMGGTLGAE